MFIVRYTGGLGNQMFQYALMVMLKQFFSEEEIYADLTRYDLTPEHDGFDLIKYFDINIDVVNNSTLKKIAPVNYWCKRLHAKWILQLFSVHRIEIINEKLEKKYEDIGIIPDYSATNFNKDAFSLNREEKNIWHYKGNWINPQYWKGYEQQICHSFSFKEELLSDEDIRLIQRMEKEESVAVHIRKGDYTGKYLYDICSEKYYKDAIERINGIKKNKNMKIYIFSETSNLNLNFCDGLENIIVSHPKQPGIDMWLMSKCKHNIIANSTFSFWSAFLNRNPEKIVIAPMYMYRREVYVKFVVPDKWILLNNLE
ncbi:MAG: alpha-1,2-fucosyltransferase [Clostridia bacterium]|nr:alpha-1,2-fucosyltransferase [Clostridia bacterium]